MQKIEIGILKKIWQQKRFDVSHHEAGLSIYIDNLPVLFKNEDFFILREENEESHVALRAQVFKKIFVREEDRLSAEIYREDDLASVWLSGVVKEKHITFILPENLHLAFKIGLGAPPDIDLLETNLSQFTNKNRDWSRHPAYKYSLYDYTFIGQSLFLKKVYKIVKRSLYMQTEDGHWCFVCPSFQFESSSVYFTEGVFSIRLGKYHTYSFSLLKLSDGDQFDGMLFPNNIIVTDKLKIKKIGVYHLGDMQDVTSSRFTLESNILTIQLSNSDRNFDSIIDGIYPLGGITLPNGNTPLWVYDHSVRGLRPIYSSLISEVKWLISHSYRFKNKKTDYLISVSVLD